jgi:hypothetical protein
MQATYALPKGLAGRGGGDGRADGREPSADDGSDDVAAK